MGYVRASAPSAALAMLSSDAHAALETAIAVNLKSRTSVTEMSARNSYNTDYSPNQVSVVNGTMALRLSRAARNQPLAGIAWTDLFLDGPRKAALC